MKNAKLATMLGLSVVLVAGAVFSASLSGSYAQAPSEQRDRMNIHDRVSATIADGRRGSAVGVISSMQIDFGGSQWLVYGPWRLVLIPSADEVEPRHTVLEQLYHGDERRQRKAPAPDVRL